MPHWWLESLSKFLSHGFGRCLFPDLCFFCALWSPPLGVCQRYYKAMWILGSLSFFCVVLQMTDSLTTWRWSLSVLSSPWLYRECSVLCVCSVTVHSPWNYSCCAVYRVSENQTGKVRFFYISPHWLLFDGVCNENKVRPRFYFINPERYWDCHRFEISSA